MTERLVLITGATGFVGTVLAPLIAQKYRVRSLDTKLFGDELAGVPNIESRRGDVTYPRDVEAAMQGVTDVVHLAGIVTDPLVDMNPQKGYAVNVEGTANVAYAAADTPTVQRFIYVSSSSVYGWAAERMGDVDEWVEPRPKTAYAMQKLQGERIVASSFGLRRGAYCIVRPATMCGPAPRPRLDTVVNVFSKQAFYNRRITVHGGSQYRSNVHVQDFAEVVAMVLDAPRELITGGIFNVTAGNMTVGEIAATVARAYEQQYGERVLIEMQNVPDPRSYRLTAMQLLATFGWQPKRTIEDAARDMFKLFESGRLGDPNADIYSNTKRMAPLMREATPVGTEAW